jgi:hypothetical protein
MRKRTPAVTNVVRRSGTALFVSSSAALLYRSEMSPTPDRGYVIPWSGILGSDFTGHPHREVSLGGDRRSDPEERPELAVPRVRLPSIRSHCSSGRDVCLEVLRLSLGKAWLWFSALIRSADGQRDRGIVRNGKVANRCSDVNRIMRHAIATAPVLQIPWRRWRSRYSKCSTRVCSRHVKEKQIIG